MVFRTKYKKLSIKQKNKAMKLPCDSFRSISNNLNISISAIKSTLCKWQKIEISRNLSENGAPQNISEQVLKKYKQNSMTT